MQRREPLNTIPVKQCGFPDDGIYRKFIGTSVVAGEHSLSSPFSYHVSMQPHKDKEIRVAEKPRISPSPTIRTNAGSVLMQRKLESLANCVIFKLHEGSYGWMN